MVSDDRAVDTAATLLGMRRARAEVFPADLFSEPAWDLLLELFVADGRGERLTGAEVSQRCNVPPQILSRWLRVLSQRELIIGDGLGNLADELTLSGAGMAGMERVIMGASDAKSEIAAR